MENTFNYIFGNLMVNNNAIKQIAKCLKTQSRFNMCMVTFTVFATLGAMSLNAQINEQEEKINKLTKEIEELKETKGE